MITRRMDEATGIIYVAGGGTWTYADIDAHYDALREMIEPLRAAGERVRVLSDVTRAVRQAPEIELYILSQMTRTFRPGDRIVILTSDLDEKMHVRGLLRDIDVTAFNSLLPAEMWLLTDDLPKIA